MRETAIFERVCTLHPHIIQDACDAFLEATRRFTPHDWALARMPGMEHDDVVDALRRDMTQRHRTCVGEYTRNIWLADCGNRIRLAELQGTFSRGRDKTYVALVLLSLSSNEELMVQRALTTLEELFIPRIILTLFCAGDASYHSLRRLYPNIPIIYGYCPQETSSVQVAAQ